MEEHLRAVKEFPQNLDFPQSARAGKRKCVFVACRVPVEVIIPPMPEHVEQLIPFVTPLTLSL
jgi:hypothetical protein